MSFLNPLGFLALIGVPILIIIYIIKNKYTEQVIASTYLWTLSERFLKHKKPISKIAGIISLILQILVVILISLAIAQPVFYVGEANSYCFILDASGSMNMEQNGKTRMERGKEQVATLIEESKNGSTYTLIYAGEQTVVYETNTDKDRALALLDGMSAAHLSVSLEKALGAAQQCFDADPAIKAYLVSDKAYSEAENLQVINVSAGEENFAVSDVKYTLADKLIVEGNAISYENDAVLTVALYIDETKESEQTLTVSKLQSTPFTFECETKDFAYVKVVIENQDALSLDNEVVVYNVTYENSYKALIVSDSPFFLQAALISAGADPNRLELAKTSEYRGASGYGLYIFDGFDPKTLPGDGAVWIVDPVSSIADSGFSVQGEVELTRAGKLSYSTSSAQIVKMLLKDVMKSDVYVAKYMKCGLYRPFTTLLSYEGNPLVFTGTNTYGNREVVFAFDLHDSNFPMLADYVTLVRNLLDYTFPTVVEEVSYRCGDKMTVNVIANCDSIRIDSPRGNVSYPDISSAVCEYTLTEAGIYTITMMTGETARTFYVYSSLPEEERIPTVSELSVSLKGTARQETKKGIYDDLLILFLLLAVLVLADWMVYCYDQYQLR